MKNKKILIVDDDLAVLELLSTLLLGSDFNVTPVSNAKEALDILKLHSFDLIITDVIMPEMNGVELVEKLISKDIKTPVIMMSGNVFAHDQQIRKFLDKGIVKCLISKPFKLSIILSKIKEYAL